MSANSSIQIIQYKKDHPKATAREISRMFSCSKQNIHQIVSLARKKDKGIPQFSRSNNRKVYISHCQYCNKDFETFGGTRKSHEICFYMNTGYMQLKCPICGIGFPLLKSQYKYKLKCGQKKFYDSRRCFTESTRGPRSKRSKDL